MMIFDASVGIDFRQNHLILTLLKRSFGRIRLVDYAIHPILPETQKEERQAQIISLVNSFFSKHQVNRERVFVAIPREKVIARFMRLPVAAKENLRKVLEYEMPKYIPFEKGEIYFDYCVLKEEKDRLHLFAVFAKKAEVDAYLSLLKRMGIQPISVQIPSAAAVNLFLYNKGGGEDDTSVLIDVSEPFFEMNLVQGKNWSESLHLPLPGEEKETKMISTFKRSGDNHRPANSTFFVYGLGVDENTLTNLKETKQLKDVLPPPMDRIQGGEIGSKPYHIYASIGIPLKGIVSPRVDLNLFGALLDFDMGRRDFYSIHE